MLYLVAAARRFYGIFNKKLKKVPRRFGSGICHRKQRGTYFMLDMFTVRRLSSVKSLP
jgi:hypothetical protein